jgi:hypothetical protein
MLCKISVFVDKTLQREYFSMMKTFLNKVQEEANKFSIFALKTLMISWQNGTQYFPRVAS